MKINGKRIKENDEYRLVYSKWKNMMDRCYNTKNSNYKNYGENGCYVCNRWHILDNFIEDFDKIDGFNYELFINGELTLDKDKKYKNNKEYSLNTCSLLTLEENNTYKPNQQKTIIGIDPNGNNYMFTNQSQFAREHNLRQSSIGDCLNKKCKTHKGWKFNYQTDNEKSID